MATKIIPESIRDFLSYNPDTGEFRWTKSRRGVRSGSIAGRIKNRGYVVISYRSSSYQAHRVAWFLTHGEQPNVIDHINHDRADNRIANLRNVDHSQNNLNHKKPRRGVYWTLHRGKRLAQACYRNKTVYTGQSILIAHFRRRMAVVTDLPIGIEHLK